MSEKTIQIVDRKTLEKGFYEALAKGDHDLRSEFKSLASRLYVEFVTGPVDDVLAGDHHSSAVCAINQAREFLIDLQYYIRNGKHCSDEKQGS